MLRAHKSHIAESDNNESKPQLTHYKKWDEEPPDPGKNETARPYYNYQEIENELKLLTIEQQFPDDELFLVEELNSIDLSNSTGSENDNESVDSVETTKFLEHGPGPPIGVTLTTKLRGNSCNGYSAQDFSSPKDELGYSSPDFSSPKVELKHNQIVLQDGDGGGGASRSVFTDDGLIELLDPDGWRRNGHEPGKPVDRGKPDRFGKTGPDIAKNVNNGQNLLQQPNFTSPSATSTHIIQTDPDNEETPKTLQGTSSSSPRKMHSLVRKTSDLSTRYARRRNKGVTLNQLRSELIGTSNHPPIETDKAEHQTQINSGDIERGKTISSTSSQSFEEITSTTTTTSTNNSSSEDDRRIRRRNKASIPRRNSSKRSQASSNATIVNSGGGAPGSGTNRVFIKEGDMRMAVYDKGIQIYDRYWFLFNDQLVVAKRTSTGSGDNPSEYRLKHKIPLNELWIGSEVHDVIRAVSGSNSHLPVKLKDAKHKEMVQKLEGKSFLIGWPSTNFVAVFKNKQERDDWLGVLNKYLMNGGEQVYRPHDPGPHDPGTTKDPGRDNFDENGHIFDSPNFNDHNSTSINLKLTTKDLHNRLRAKYVAVHSTTTARDVVNQALNEFQIYSNASEYSLLVGKGQGGTITADDYRMIDRDKLLMDTGRGATAVLGGEHNNNVLAGSTDLSLLSGSNNAVATLVGPESIMAYWRKSVRESISTSQKSRESLEYYSQFLSFDQLEPQFRYLFELKRFPPEKTSKNKPPAELALPQNQLSQVLTTLVMSKDPRNMERIEEEDFDNDTVLTEKSLKSSPFWKIKRKPTKINTDSIKSSSFIHKSESSVSQNLGLFGEKQFSITTIGSPHEIWMLMAVLSKRVDSVVGVFRKPAAAKNVRILKSWLNQNYQTRNHGSNSESGHHSGSESTGSHKSELIERLQTSSVHSLACTLKEYLRSQPEPLFSHYDDWLKIGEIGKNPDSSENSSDPENWSLNNISTTSRPENSTEKRVESLNFIINSKMSDTRRKLLAAIVSILTKVCEARETTAMTANSCAISLTPSLIWHEEMDASLDARNVSCFIHIVEDIIIHSKTLFPEKELGRLGEILTREEARRRKSGDSRRGSSSDDESLVSSNGSSNGSSNMSSNSNCDSHKSNGSNGHSSGVDSGLSKTNSAENPEFLISNSNSSLPRKAGLNDRSSSDSVCKQSSKCSSVDSLDLLDKSQITNSSIFTDEGVVSMTPSRTASNSTGTLHKFKPNNQNQHQASHNYAHNQNHNTRPPPSKKFTNTMLHPIQTPSHLVHLEMEESFV